MTHRAAKPKSDVPEVEAGQSPWESRENTRALVLLALTALGLYLCYRLTVPFLPALTWAVTIAVLVVPVHRWIETKISRPGVAAGLSVLIVAVIVVVPASFVAERMIAEAAKGAEAVRGHVESGGWRRLLESNPSLAPLGQWIEQKVDLSGTLGSAAGLLTDKGASLVRGSVRQLVGLLLTFYLLFYFLRDRAAGLESLRAVLPLTGAEARRLFQRVADTIYATIYGTVAVAAIQGVLGGLMFWWLGLPAPLLWGLVMGLLAIIPVLGAFIVWIPAAIFLALAGSWVKAIVLIVWGGVVVAGIDNLLYPILVGNRLKMHTVLAFISVVGGLFVFGASGLILGPVVLTITLLLLEIWRARVARPDTAAA